MAGVETVDKRQNGPHARGFRSKAVPAQQRIEPDQFTTPQRQPFDFCTKQGRIATLQPVSDQQYHRPLPQNATRPVTIEPMQRCGNLGAPLPVRGLASHRLQRVIHIFEMQRTADVGQLCAKGKPMHSAPSHYSEPKPTHAENASSCAHNTT